jgi:hypothetical protein
MNNPKLTNVLLIALVVLNCFLIVCLAGHRHRQHNHMEMAGMFRRHHHRAGEWAFRHHHNRFQGNFRNFHHMGGEGDYENGRMENRQAPNGI